MSELRNIKFDVENPGVRKFVVYLPGEESERDGWSAVTAENIMMLTHPKYGPDRDRSAALRPRRCRRGRASPCACGAMMMPDDLRHKGWPIWLKGLHCEVLAGELILVKRVVEMRRVPAGFNFSLGNPTIDDETGYLTQRFMVDPADYEELVAADLR